MFATVREAPIFQISLSTSAQLREGTLVSDTDMMELTIHSTMVQVSHNNRNWCLCTESPFISPAKSSEVGTGSIGFVEVKRKDSGLNFSPCVLAMVHMNVKITNACTDNL